MQAEQPPLMAIKSSKCLNDGEKQALKDFLVAQRPKFITLETLKSINWTPPKGVNDESQKLWQSIHCAIKQSKTYFTDVFPRLGKNCIYVTYGENFGYVFFFWYNLTL
jgi:hypothetical protein